MYAKKHLIDIENEFYGRFIVGEWHKMWICIYLFFYNWPSKVYELMIPHSDVFWGNVYKEISPSSVSYYTHWSYASHYYAMLKKGTLYLCCTLCQHWSSLTNRVFRNMYTLKVLVNHLFSVIMQLPTTCNEFIEAQCMCQYTRPSLFRWWLVAYSAPSYYQHQ